MAEGSVRSLGNFVVQLDHFWTAGRYFNKLYFINV